MSTQFASQKFEYVKASEIWPTAIDFEDKGQRPGLVRGYNPKSLLKTARLISCFALTSKVSLKNISMANSISSILMSTVSS